MTARARIATLIVSFALVAALVPATAAVADDVPPVDPAVPIEAAGAYTGAWTVDIDDSTTPFEAVVNGPSGGFPGLPSYTYQWFRGATAAATTAATAASSSSTYSPVAADAGQFLRVRVVLTLPGYSATVKYSAASQFSLVPSGPPILSPSVDAKPLVGETFFVQPASLAGLTYSRQGCACGSGPYPTLFDHYQWLRDGVAISGATSQTYRSTSTDLGHKLSVRFLAWHDGYAPGVVTSQPTVAKLILGTIETNSGYPHITIQFGTQLGTSTPAEVLADPGTLPVTVTYRWLRDSAAIPGATHATYIPVAADNGHGLQVEWRLTKTGYATRVVTSGSYDFDIRRSGGGPYINGSPVFGQVLEAQLDSYEWNYGALSDPDFAYQWYRKAGSATAVAIPSATSRTYTPVVADVGAVLSVRVTTSTVPLAPLVETFGPTTAITAATIDYTPGTKPLVTAGPADAQLVAEIPAGSIHTTGTAVAWQWFRIPAGHEPIVIPGATHSAFTLTTAYAAQQLEARATITRAGFAPVQLFSVPTTYDMTATSEAIEGTAQVGASLDVHTTPYTYTGGATVANVHRSYVWYRNNVAIPGATGPSYDVAAADLGKTITVREGAAAPGAIPASVLLAGIGPVVPGENSDDGTAQVSENPATDTLTASLALLSPSHPTPVYSYVWQRDGHAVAGATTSAYKLTSADAGKTIRVVITVKRPGFVVVDANYSRMSDGRVYSIHVNGGSAEHFAVTPTVGVPLSVEHAVYRTDFDGSTPAGTPVYSYQWYRKQFGSSAAAVAITGATHATYSPSASYAGYLLQVRVNVKYPGYVLFAAPLSTPSDPVAPGSLGWNGTSRPSITIPGNTLKATAVSVPSSKFAVAPASISYQWERNDLYGGVGFVNIPGATGSSYTLTRDDFTCDVAVIITFKRPGYVSQSIESSVVVNRSIEFAGTSSIVGVATTGNYLTVFRSAIAPDPGGVMYSYQWWRHDPVGGTDTIIPGAKSQTYRVAAADTGYQLFAYLTPVKTGWMGGTVTTDYSSIAGP